MIYRVVVQYFRSTYYVLFDLDFPTAAQPVVRRGETEPAPLLLSVFLDMKPKKYSNDPTGLPRRCRNPAHSSL